MQIRIIDLDNSMDPVLVTDTNRLPILPPTGTRLELTAMDDDEKQRWYDERGYQSRTGIFSFLVFTPPTFFLIDGEYWIELAVRHIRKP